MREKYFVKSDFDVSCFLIVGVIDDSEEPQNTQNAAEAKQSTIGKCLSEVELVDGYIYAVEIDNDRMSPFSRGAVVNAQITQGRITFDSKSTWGRNEFVAGEIIILSDGEPIPDPAAQYNKAKTMKAISDNNNKIDEYQKQVAKINVSIENLQAENQDLTDSLK